MKKIFYIDKSMCWRWVLLAIIFSLSGCGSSTHTDAPVPVSMPGYSIEAYRIGVGDRIRIEVWGNANLSSEVPVRPDGKVSMSLIGDVLAAGETTESLAEAITRDLLEYIKNPQVTIIVSNPSSADFQHRVRVTGAVNSPQSIPYRKGMTVLDLILLAGGPNEFARLNSAKLYRRGAGEVNVYPIRLGDILKSGLLESNYELVPSDIVTVPERSF